MMKHVPAVFALSVAAACAAPQPVNPHSAIVAEFTKRVDAYVKLHKTVEGDLPKLKPTDSPEIILAHQKELARKLREARSTARQGDIFTAEISQEFRRLLGFAMQPEDKKPIQASLKRAEPVKLALRVNDPYPNPAPLQSTPPTLLLNLPTLPPEVDYRVIGHSLALRDVKANLVIDFIPNVIP